MASAAIEQQRTWTRALVAGASSGIGEAIADVLAAAGVEFVLVGRNLAALELVATRGRELGVDVEIICADLSDEAGLATVLGAIRNADPMIDLSSIARELEQPVHSSICHRPIPT